MSKTFCNAKILSQVSMGDNIYDMVLAAPEIAACAGRGQFISVYTGDPSKILPRPISLCEVNRDLGILRIIYRVTGSKTGTEEFAKKVPGDELKILGPLGNRFPLVKEDRKNQDTEGIAGRKVMIVGGGIGVFPLYELTKEAVELGTASEISVVLGYRSSNLYIRDEFEALGVRLYIATDDGSVGVKGNVIDLLKAEEAAGSPVEADVIYACGPKPMLRGIKAYAEEKDIECYVSLEERMACGIGACLACVTQTTEVDDHSHVKNARICADGPVFAAKEVVL